MIIGTALCVGAGVAVTGVIGFVGLVVPHLLRKLCANDPAKLLLASAGGGASLLLAADIAVRCIAVNAELKLGVITALLGAPFFLYLIFRLRALEQ
jgi:iron complex transport system permease protein